MSSAVSMRDRLVSEFAENYMEKLFYFCLKKTGSSTEAEDLTQDIALNILTALNKGTTPTSFSAWVWQIARNRYSVWADEKHRRSESVTGSDIGDYEIENESENVLDEMIHSEQLSLFRRELAFISSNYRNIVVAYYMENQSMRVIASRLSLSLETVKKRLQRARIILKEGMDMAREFGVRSYNPEQIAFVMNGNGGEWGQPWSIIWHLLYKNIFLETYENPQTAEELALELGIALPYMEEELEYLVREELLRKSNNKYETNFPIVSREEQRVIYDANKTIQKPLTDKLCEMIDLYVKEEGAKVNVGYVGYEAAKWTLLVYIFDWFCKNSAGHYCNTQEWKAPYPSRPGNGAWTLKGFETVDWKEPAFVGLHGYLSRDKVEVKKEMDFGQFKFYIGGYYAKTPDHLTYSETYTLWLVCAGKAKDGEKGYIEKLLEYGYIKNTDGVIEPNVVVFDCNIEEPFNAELAARLTALKSEISALIDQVPTISRGYVVEQALEDGWLKYGENTINTIGAYIYL
ncbi:MAG: sigma-70 family RNA polymerase sigma factor [Lachnospiraceae bacterium]|nr:sigma-70 family RNA polymerase sigma factor [Lachnospiraceae bacterium]